MAKSPTKPLEITAYMLDGRIVSTDGIIMFDSILYHAWFLKHAPHVLRGEGYDNYNAGYIGLPLRQLPGNRYAASKGVYEETSRNIEHYNKRPDFFASDKIGYLDQDKGLISDSVGKYRAYRNPVVVRTVKNAVIKFYAMGDPEKVSDLLSLMPAVGKKPSMGWGIVEKFEVREINEDYSLFHPKHGLMRPVPIEESENYDFDFSPYPIINYGIKSPYWKPVNFRQCYVPIVR